MSLNVRRYKKEDENNWNSFISNAKNATFLFDRNYMDYHKDKFIDNSIIVEENDQIVSVLPANFENDIVVSHSGLTYGGFVFGVNSSTSSNIKYTKSILKFLYTNNIPNLILKSLPDFYSKCSQSEIEYSMFLLEAKTFRVDTALVLDYSSNLKRKMPKGRKSEISKAKKVGVIVEESENCNYFWNSILTPNLNSRFNVQPVHTLDEIMSLKKNNPKKIRQFHAIVDNEIVAGTTIFETDTTVHLQYLAGNEKSRNTGALDFLFYYLINYYSEKKDYFDFGIVNENNGKKVNIGMLKWKESFGARFYLHKFYEINTSNYVTLEVDNYKSK